MQKETVLVLICLVSSCNVFWRSTRERGRHSMARPYRKIQAVTGDSPDLVIPGPPMLRGAM